MRKAATALAMVCSVLFLPAVALAQTPPDGSPTEGQYPGDTDGPTVVIDEAPDADPPAGDPDSSSGAADDFDDNADAADAPAVAVDPASPAPASPSSAPSTTSAAASATASATASASASPAPRSEALPETGGVGGVALAAAVLLASTGLLARWAVARS